MIVGAYERRGEERRVLFKNEDGMEGSWEDKIESKRGGKI